MFQIRPSLFSKTEKKYVKSTVKKFFRNQYLIVVQ